MAKNTDGLSVTGIGAGTLDTNNGIPLALAESLRGGGIGNYTTTERNAIDGRILDNNMIIYNTTDSRFEVYSGGTRNSSGSMSGGSWAAFGTSHIDGGTYTGGESIDVNSSDEINLDIDTSAVSFSSVKSGGGTYNVVTNLLATLTEDDVRVTASGSSYTLAFRLADVDFFDITDSVIRITNGSNSSEHLVLRAFYGSTAYNIRISSAISGTDQLDSIAAGTDITILSGGERTIHIDDLSDVQITSAASNDILRWNGTNWVNEQFSANLNHWRGTYSDTATYSNGDTVLFNSHIYIWTATADSTAGTDPDDDTTNWVQLSVQAEGLNDLTDVVLTSAADGQILRNNGTNFVNVNLITDHITDLPAGASEVKKYELSIATDGAPTWVETDSAGDLTAGNGITITNDTIAQTDITQNNTTATDSPSYNGTFTATSGVTRDGQGNVTEVETTTYTLPVTPTYVGADADNSGTVGLVPAATSAQREHFLRGDGTWQEADAHSDTDNHFYKYATGEAYAVDDVVWNDSDDKIYQVTVAITGTNNTAFSDLTVTELSPGISTVFDDSDNGLVPAADGTDEDTDDHYLTGDGNWKYANLTVYNTTDAYEEDDQVIYNDYMWIAQRDFSRATEVFAFNKDFPQYTNVLFGTPAVRYIANSAVTHPADFDNSAAYATVGTYVVFGSAVYKNNVAITAPVAWDTDSDYSIGDIVIFNGTIYVADAASDSTEADPATNTADWDVFTGLNPNDSTNWDLTDDLDPDNSDDWSEVAPSNNGLWQLVGAGLKTPAVYWEENDSAADHVDIAYFNHLSNDDVEIHKKDEQHLSDFIFAERYTDGRWSMTQSGNTVDDGFPIALNTAFVAVVDNDGSVGTVTVTNTTAPTGSFLDLEGYTVWSFPSADVTYKNITVDRVYFTHGTEYHLTSVYVPSLLETVASASRLDALESDTAHNTYDPITTADAVWTFTSDPTTPNSGTYNFVINNGYTVVGGDHRLDFNLNDEDGTNTRTADNIAHLAKGHRIRLTHGSNNVVYRFVITGVEFDPNGSQSTWVLGLDLLDRSDGVTENPVHTLDDTGATFTDFEVSQPAGPSGFITNDPNNGDQEVFVLRQTTNGDEITWNYVGGNSKTVKAGNIQKYSDSKAYAQDDVVWFGDDNHIYVWTKPGGSTAGDSPSDNTTDWQNLSSNSNNTVDVLSNVATNTIIGRNDTGSGDSEELTPAEVRTMLNVTDNATEGFDMVVEHPTENDQTIQVTTSTYDSDSHILISTDDAAFAFTSSTIKKAGDFGQNRIFIKDDDVDPKIPVGTVLSDELGQDTGTWILNLDGGVVLTVDVSQYGSKTAVFETDTGTGWIFESNEITRVGNIVGFPTIDSMTLSLGNAVITTTASLHGDMVDINALEALLEGYDSSINYTDGDPDVITYTRTGEQAYRKKITYTSGDPTQIRVWRGAVLADETNANLVYTKTITYTDGDPTAVAFT